ncbi:ABC transporter ATP-binding protein [Litchfieldella qijiaojingensis]|uniref:ABC transporter ATP-binding protein n=1 Tax=Litchfieldella qijiaojingensis TaxID=980347 RepID=A0ABQ2Z3Q5_9GAMM|nr:ABC transporter ATP-binding protein [Halomonas qijiaojingensis]GGY01360.1 ABC transporter ATP-binding protein [Halomonas qijiaojingensis]
MLVNQTIMQHQARPEVCAPVLEVEHLTVGVPGVGAIINDLNLTIRRGEVVALVGESGSGKSMTARSLMRLMPSGISILNGSVRVCGDEVLSLSEEKFNEFRGARISMLFQQPHVMLDPTCTVGAQAAEALHVHRHLSAVEEHERVLQLFRDVGIPEPEERMKCYPHQMSGGMAQRVMIAAALSAEPDLLIADEPTTALDVTVQAQILQLLDRKRRESDLSILLITHDLSVVSAIADRVAVMYSGEIVEQGTTQEILRNPKHPYTQSLIHCALLEADETGQLYAIPGNPPELLSKVEGCRFRSRCQVAEKWGHPEICSRLAPPMVEHGGPGCCARCWIGAPNDMQVQAIKICQSDEEGHRDDC